MDPSMTHWGIATGIFENGQVTFNGIQVLEPRVPEGKQVRQNSKDIEVAQQLYEGACLASRYADAVFVEVPVGSQSARAMCSYGICVALTAALRAGGIPIFQVTDSEGKAAAGQKKTASKKDMVAWATSAYPELPWPTYPRDGQALISESKANHMADAIAALLAGLKLTSFRQLLALANPSHPNLSQMPVLMASEHPSIYPHH